MKVTVTDAFREYDKVALRWNLSAAFNKEFLDVELSNKDVTKGVEIIQIVREKFLTHGVEILHFESGKIKEAWTVFDVMTPAHKLTK